MLFAGAAAWVSAAFAQDPELGILAAGTVLIDDEDAVVSYVSVARPLHLWQFLQSPGSFSRRAVFLRRAVLEKVGFCDESLSWGAESDLLLRIGRRFKS